MYPFFRKHRATARRGMTLVEVVIAGGVSVLLTAALMGLTLMTLRVQKSGFAQQYSVYQGKKAIEWINDEIHLAVAPLTLLDEDDESTTASNHVQFHRYGESVTRSLRLISDDDDYTTPFDNTLVYDPDVDSSNDEVIIAKWAAPGQDQGTAFAYSDSTTPLRVTLRIGDPPDLESQERTGLGTQGMEITSRWPRAIWKTE